MKEYLKNELLKQEERILHLQENADKETTALLNNILTPVIVVLDELEHYSQRDTEDFACSILNNTRTRLDDLFGPETMKSSDIPRPRDTIKTAMNFEED